VNPSSPRCAALCARLGAYDAVVEIGIGRRSAVAAALAARGVSVTATDVRPRAVPRNVRFVRDNVLDPDLDVYRGAGAIYALNSPPDLHRPIRSIARAIDVPFLFTTLGADPLAIDASIETIPGDTLFRATDRDRPGGRSRSDDRSRANDHGSGYGRGRPPVIGEEHSDGESR